MEIVTGQMFGVFFCIPHLHPVSHLYECTGWVKGPGSTGVQVGSVVVVDNLYVVHTVGLKHTVEMQFQSTCKIHKKKKI